MILQYRIRAVNSGAVARLTKRASRAELEGRREDLDDLWPVSEQGMPVGSRRECLRIVRAWIYLLRALPEPAPSGLPWIECPESGFEVWNATGSGRRERRHRVGFVPLAPAGGRYEGALRPVIDGIYGLIEDAEGN